MFIWIGANTANADTAVGITHLNKKCDFKFNNLILNNNQPFSYLFTGRIIWIGIISLLTYWKVFIALISRITVLKKAYLTGIEICFFQEEVLAENTKLHIVRIYKTD